VSASSRALAALGLTAGLVAGVVAGCFSEREAAGPVEGECRFPLGDDIPGSTVVVISRFEYSPQEVRVRAGERITWINCGDDEHTSTADGGEWQSPLLVPGDAFTQTFDAPGEFPYFCEPHPFMLGRVIVE
jgi:plastocyanin